MATIDNLKLNIEATDRASGKIESLSRALSSLKQNVPTGTRLKNTADGIKSVADSANSIDDKSVTNLERLGSALQSMTTRNINLSRVSSGIKELSQTANTITDDVISRIERLGSALQVFRGINLSGLSRISKRFTAEQQIAGVQQSETETVGASTEVVNKIPAYERLRSVLLNIGQGFANATRNAIQFARAVGRIALNETLKGSVATLRLIGNLVRRLVSPIQAIFRSIGRIAFYRIIRGAIKAIGQGIRDGVQNLARFSKLVNETDSNKANRVMSLYASNLLYLKNALGTAIIPLLKMLEPIFDTIINKAVAMANVLAQVFSFLSGSATYTRAKYYYIDYADSLDKASGSASKLNKQLAKFDELNNLTTSGGSGSGADMDYLKMFEDPVMFDDWIANLKNADWYTIGETISTKIRESLDNIDWDKVYANVKNFGKNLAGFLNGLIQPDTFKSIGKTIAKSIGTAIEFSLAFGEEFDGENFGASIAEGINGFFENFPFEDLAESLNTWVDNLEDTLAGFAKTLDWKTVFSGLGDFFSNLELDTVMVTATALSIATKNPVGLAVAGLALTGLGAGEVFATLTGNDELAKQFSEQNPFSGGALGDLTYDLFEKYTIYGLADKLGEKTGNYINEVRKNAEEFGSLVGKILGEYIVRGVKKTLDTSMKIIEPIKENLEKLKSYFTAVSANSQMGHSKAGKADVSFAKLAENIGSDIVKGIKKGIDNQLDKLKFGKVLKTFFDGICDVLGIHSPATTMYPIGRDIILGIFAGMSLVDFAQKMTEWFNNNVMPWFSVDKWTKATQGMKTGITNKWSETVSEWKTKISNWWTTYVTPWFATEKWKGVAEGLKSGIIAKANEFVLNWKSTLTSWWQNDVSTWFTYQKWFDIANNIKSGFAGKWNEITLWWNGALGGFKKSAEDNLTYQFFKGLGENIGKGIQDPVETTFKTITALWEGLKALFADTIGINMKVNVDRSALEGLSDITEGLTDAITAGQDIVDKLKDDTGTPKPTTGQQSSSTAQIPDEIKKKLGIKTMALGGYPSVGSLFIAGERGAELVGNINGRTGVANNDQITEAMYGATYDAMTKALSENGMSVILEGDADGMFRIVQKKSREYSKRTGNPAFA